MFLRGFTALGLLVTAAFLAAGQTSTSETSPERRCYVRMFQFSPDSKTVVSYTFEGALLSWDLENRKLQRSLRAKADNTTFDPLGNVLTIEAAAEGIRLIDAVRNQEVKFLAIPISPIFTNSS